MDGVFMRKTLRRLLFLLVVVCCFHIGGWMTDRQTLDSDPLQIRDRLMDSLGQAIRDATDLRQAGGYLQAHWPRIRAAADDMLGQLASGEEAKSFFWETFVSQSWDTAPYHIRFYFLEWLEKVENFLFGD